MGWVEALRFGCFVLQLVENSSTPKPEHGAGLRLTTGSLNRSPENIKLSLQV